MKTPDVTLRSFQRMFSVREGKVVVEEATLLVGAKKVPIVFEAYIHLAPLRVTMLVWSELVHAGKDPIGRDFLDVKLVFVLPTTWIRRPAEELWHEDCDSANDLYLRLVSMRDTLVAANHLQWLSRLSDHTIHLVFGSLFDAVSALEKQLETETKKRGELWENHEEVMWLPPREHSRFRTDDL